MPKHTNNVLELYSHLSALFTIKNKPLLKVIAHENSFVKEIDNTHPFQDHQGQNGQLRLFQLWNVVQKEESAKRQQKFNVFVQDKYMLPDCESKDYGTWLSVIVKVAVPET